jgi:hypothetical protein
MRTKATRLVVIAVLLSFVGAVAPLAAQSLADLARQEQDRRKAIKKPSKVLTNEDLKPAPAVTGSTATTAPAAGGTTPGAGSGGAAAKGQEGEKTSEPAKDQAYWSGRAKDLQAQLDRDETFAAALQSQINALTTQYVNQADPVQQAKVANDRQKALSQLNGLTKQVEDDKKAIATLQEDARRAGVPAGWLR